MAPFTVLCLAKEDSLLLIEPTDLRAGRRFGADLLAAVTGNWADAARQLLFEWPQAGIANDELSVSKALGAFVSRQLGESGVRMKLGTLMGELTPAPQVVGIEIHDADEHMLRQFIGQKLYCLAPLYKTDEKGELKTEFGFYVAG